MGNPLGIKGLQKGTSIGQAMYKVIIIYDLCFFTVVLSVAQFLFFSRVIRVKYIIFLVGKNFINSLFVPSSLFIISL